MWLIEELPLPEARDAYRRAAWSALEHANNGDIDKATLDSERAMLILIHIAQLNAQA